MMNLREQKKDYKTVGFRLGPYNCWVGSCNYIEGVENQCDIFCGYGGADHLVIQSYSLPLLESMAELQVLLNSIRPCPGDIYFLSADPAILIKQADEYLYKKVLDPRLVIISMRDALKKVLSESKVPLKGIEGYNPKNRQPEINKHVLMRSKDCPYRAADTFVGYLSDPDGTIYPVGDIGENYYCLMEDIEWWAELPVIEVES